MEESVGTRGESMLEECSAHRLWLTRLKVTQISAPAIPVVGGVVVVCDEVRVDQLRKKRCLQGAAVRGSRDLKNSKFKMFGFHTPRFICIS